MRSNNPVLSRPDAFTRNYQQPSHGYYNPNAPADQYSTQYGPGYVPQPPQTGRMSIEDVITKTAILMLILAATGGVTWLLLPIELLLPAAVVGSIVAFVTVMVVSMRRTVPVAGVIAYSAVEGVVIGAWSRVFEFMYPGIVMQAVFGTVVAAFVLLGLYQYMGTRVRGQLAKVVTVSVIAYAIVSLINLVMVLAGVGIGLTVVGSGAGPLAWLFAGVGVVLASASLLMDFDAIESGVRNGAPESESWRGAFGLVVTMIWLYTLLLRILSFFRN